MKLITIILVILALMPVVLAADTSNYFSVKDTGGQYTALPGDKLTVNFTLSNRGYVFPKNVTAYFDPCPVDWYCGRRMFSFNRSWQDYPVNLTIKVPESALPKRYTFYILLESEFQTRRGNDRVLIDVLTEEDANTISYSEYNKPEEEPKVQTPPPPVVLPAAEVKKEVVAVPVEVPVVENTTPVSYNDTDIKENVQRLEGSRNFIEYISIVLVVVLVFIAVGAYLSYRKK